MFKNANEQLALTPDQRQILLVPVALLNAQNGITHIHNLGTYVDLADLRSLQLGRSNWAEDND